ncbi:PspC domain-containing protein [uncultured Erythrobacter sp.]|uniref:PspC domain-containing protein n=1 Tax=uncultured Erythrobacter sp. TaxID=263913 RepID=UPI00260A074E|nr:PspC domain-containing protein [uncultured Erythrobacter sp.]
MSNVTRKPNGTPPSNSFRLDKTNAKLAGVCGGIANYSNIDPMLVRVGFVVGAFVSLGTAALIYLAIALIAD